MLVGWNGVVGGERWDPIAARRGNGKMLRGKRRGRTDMPFWMGAWRVAMIINNQDLGMMP